MHKNLYRLNTYTSKDSLCSLWFKVFPFGSGYAGPEAELATQAYIKMAKKHDLDPAQMALAFIRQQPFVCATIIGTTSMDQLASNISSPEATLSEPCLADIERIHSQYPNPCP